jgi:hypothetical protein
MRSESDLVKVLYIIPEGEEDAGVAEGLWAFPLGNQLYELQNIPVFAEYLNVEDVVRCDEPPDTAPVIRERVKPSGNRTLRVIFRDETSDEEAVDTVIMPLLEKGIVYEMAAKGHCMFNIPPDADYVGVRDFLREKDVEGILWLYEQE